MGYGGQWGNYTDVESGYVRMGFRDYDPTTCRFLTRDPLGYEGGINLYAYCRNNPINRFDPLGLQDDGGPEGITLGSTTSLGTSLHRNVNKEMNRQIVKPIAGVVYTAAELHPWTPAAKALYGKDNQGKRIGTGERLLQAGSYFLAGAGAIAGKALTQFTKIFRTSKGITNGKYIVDAVGMVAHVAGKDATKSQFLFNHDADAMVLRAAEHADAHGLWIGSKARVKFNGPVGVHGRTGELTEYLNVYRNKNGFIHGAPGSP